MLGLPLGMILGFIGSVVSAVFQFVYYALVIILPTLIQYVGVPLFLFGCLTGLGVSGAVLFGIVSFFYIYYNYLKKVKNINPYEKAKEKLQEQ
jgi:hypothetical protein